jgi:hypothetical protein
MKKKTIAEKIFRIPTHSLFFFGGILVSIGATMYLLILELSKTLAIYLIVDSLLFFISGYYCTRLGWRIELIKNSCSDAEDRKKCLEGYIEKYSNQFISYLIGTIIGAVLGFILIFFITFCYIWE